MVKKLNIVLSYPVKWDQYKIFRDYIQNFYDALGYRKFKDFDHYYNESDEELVMRAPSSFKKEWLLYLGVSSKRESEGDYAGRFGEGFKIAALCSLRDMGWNVRMESEDWQLEVITIKDHIENKPVDFLGYDISDRFDDGFSVLRLRRVKPEQYRIFKNEIKKFYYPENDVLGEKLVDKYMISICFPSEEYRKSCINKAKGILFLTYQVRYFLSFPLIICCHFGFSFNGDDRDRDYLSGCEAESVIKSIFEMLTAEEAFTVLLALKDFWHVSSGKNRMSCHVSFFIDVLINIVLHEPEMVQKFHNEYKNELITDHWVNAYGGRKKIAKQWFGASEYSRFRRRVRNTFYMLGIESIEELCESNNGFIVSEIPNVKENKYIDILKLIVKEHFMDIVIYDEMPRTLVITNDNVPVRGVASSVKGLPAQKNSFGLIKRRYLEIVYLQRKVLQRDLFEEALSVYLHELSHQFGGDNSAAFHKVLLLISKRMIEIGSTEIRKYRNMWEAI